MPFAPISLTNPTALGAGTSANIVKPPTAFWGHGVPRVTNRTWTNLVVSNGDQTVCTYPYLYKANLNYLEMGYQNTVTNTATFVAMNYTACIRFNALATTFNSRKVMSDNPFGCEYAYTTATVGQEMKTWFISGQAFTTVKYANLTPSIQASGAITRVNTTTGGTLTSATFTGEAFEIEYNNGQVWMLYTPVSISGNVSNSPWAFNFSSVYNGIVKVAYLGQATEGAVALASKRVILDSYGTNDSYVIGGTIDNTTFSGDTASFKIDWTKTGTNPVIQFSVPHHEATIQSPNYAGITMRAMKGVQKLVIGDSWTFTEQLTTKRLDYDPFATADYGAIDSALAVDYTYVPDSDANINTYFGFKKMQKLAQIAVIANQRGDITKRNIAIATLKAKINPWLNYTNPNPMIYDTDYGGYSSIQAITISGSYYGAGEYNDHHFHYGYFIYSCAVIAKYDPAWATSTVIDKVNLFTRDILNPSASDNYFPQFRSKDWYSGHAWAGGLSVFGDVNNQESTSEDVNAWYGCMCWFEAIGNTQMMNLARLSLTLSSRSAIRYWQIADVNIYNVPFANNKMVGILWGTKCEYNTFFGNNIEYIHAIQMLPYTPVTKELFPNPTYNSDEWNYILNNIINRTTAQRAYAVTGGTGYSGSNGSFVSGSNTFTVANNVQVTGGAGTGLLVNMNINMTAGGVIQDVYVVSTARGVGYAQNNVITPISGTGGLTGGSGASIRIETLPTPEWHNLLNKFRALTDPNDAWNRVNAIAGYDNGDSKTATLAYISQFRYVPPVIITSNNYPANNANEINTRTPLAWTPTTSNALQDVQLTLATDTGYTSPILSLTNLTNPYYNMVTPLNKNQSYIWRYKDSSSSTWIVGSSFITASQDLNYINAQYKLI